MKNPHIPPEWSPHAATWLQWPKGIEKKFEATFCQIVRALLPHEEVHVIVSDTVVESSAHKTLKSRASAVHFHRIPCDWSWCRDNGPIFAQDADGPLIIDFGFRGWTGKPPYENDDAVPKRVADELGIRVVSYDLIVEGGALEYNGNGKAIAPLPCLQNRNPDTSPGEMNKALREALGLNEVVWLKTPPPSDKMTHGHIDGIARFVSESTVVVGKIEDPCDKDYPAYEDAARILANAKFEVRRIDADYVCWYVANNVVLMGTYGKPKYDTSAKEELQSLSDEFWGGREVVGIDVRTLWRSGGGLHCVTMQQPLSI